MWKERSLKFLCPGRANSLLLLFPLLGLHRVYNFYHRTFFLLSQNLSGRDFLQFDSLVHLGLLNL
jgi:hypothetical protein